MQARACDHGSIACMPDRASFFRVAPDIIGAPAVGPVIRGFRFRAVYYMLFGFNGTGQACHSTVLSQHSAVVSGGASS